MGVVAAMVGNLLSPVARAQLPLVDSLQMSYVTTLRTPDGTEIAREHSAPLPFLPAALNVDNSLGPDLLATLAPAGLDELKLTVRKLTTVDPFRVEVVVVLRSPLGLVELPRERVRFGYDARGPGAPANFEANLVFGSLFGGSGTNVEVIFGAVSPRPILTIVGELFDGEPLARRNPLGGAFQYRPMPAGGSVAFGIDSHGYDVRLHNNDLGVDTRLSAQVSMVDRGREVLRARTSVTLPRRSSLTAEYTESFAAGRTLAITPSVFGDSPAQMQVNVDAEVNQPTGYTAPLTLTAAMSLPEGRTDINHRDGRIQYVSPARAERLELRVGGLPSPANNVFVEATSLPPAFSFFDGSRPSQDGIERIGVAEIAVGERIGSLDVRVWDNSAPEPSDPRLEPGFDNRNVIDITRRVPPFANAPAGRLAVRAHVEDVSRAVLERNARGPVLLLGFGTSRPWPITAKLNLRPNRRKSLTLDATISSPPRTIVLPINEDQGPFIALVTSGTIPHAELRIGTMDLNTDKSFGAALTLRDVPPLVRFCASASRDLCVPSAPFDFPHTADGRRLALRNDLNVLVETNRESASLRMRLDGVVCLPRSDRPFDAATACLVHATTNPTADTLSPTGKGLVLRNVRLRELDFEFGTGDSEAAAENHLVKIWLHSRRDVNFDGIRYHNGPPGRSPDTDLRLRNPGLPLTAARFIGLMDVDPVPNVEYRDGELNCGGLRAEVDVPGVGAVEFIGDSVPLGTAFRGILCSDY